MNFIFFTMVHTTQGNCFSIFIIRGGEAKISLKTKKTKLFWKMSCLYSKFTLTAITTAWHALSLIGDMVKELILENSSGNLLL